MDLFVSVFVSPLALVLYGVLGIKLSANGEAGCFKTFVIIASVATLIGCRMGEPYSFHGYVSSFFTMTGEYLFGLLMLLCLWGFKRAEKVEEPLFENLAVEEEPSIGRSPQFKKFVFFVYFAVSLVGFVVSINSRQELEHRFQMIEEYNSKLADMEERMQEIYESKHLTKEQFKDFSDSLSAWKEKYRDVLQDVLYYDSKVLKKCEWYLSHMEHQVIWNEEIARRYHEKNAEFMSELQQFISDLPEKLNTTQYESNSEKLQSLYDFYLGVIRGYAESDDFSAESVQLYQQCVQELESRKQVKK